MPLVYSPLHVCCSWRYASIAGASAVSFVAFLALTRSSLRLFGVGLILRSGGRVRSKCGRKAATPASPAPRFRGGKEVGIVAWPEKGPATGLAFSSTPDFSSTPPPPLALSSSVT